MAKRDVDIVAIAPNTQNEKKKVFLMREAHHVGLLWSKTSDLTTPSLSTLPNP